MLANQLPDVGTNLVEPEADAAVQIQDHGFAVELTKHDVRRDRDGIAKLEAGARSKRHRGRSGTSLPTVYGWGKFGGGGGV